jgi:hypothetical protein
LSDYEHNAIRRRNSQGEIETLMHNWHALWPDTLSLAADGYLCFTANQQERQLLFHNGQNLRQKPYVLFRFKVDGTRIPVSAGVQKISPVGWPLLFRLPLTPLHGAFLARQRRSAYKILRSLVLEWPIGSPTNFVTNSNSCESKPVVWII